MGLSQHVERKEQSTGILWMEQFERVREDKSRGSEVEYDRVVGVPNT